MSKWLGRKKWIAVIEKTHGRCGYCGCEISKNNYSIDHIIPKSIGGSNDLSNLLLCCRACNSMKGRKDIDDYRIHLNFKGLISEFGFSTQQVKWLIKNTNICEVFEPINVKFFFEVRKHEPYSDKLGLETEYKSASKTIDVITC